MYMHILCICTYLCMNVHVCAFLRMGFCDFSVCIYMCMTSCILDMIMYHDFAFVWVLLKHFLKI